MRFSYRGYGECGYGSDFWLIDLAAESPLASMAPLRSPVSDGTSDGCPRVQFSPTSRWLAIDDLLWDLASDRPTVQAMTLGGLLVAFHPSERFVAVEGGELGHGIRFVTLDPEALLDEVCLRAGRNLSAEEWRAAFPGQEYRPLCPNVAVPPWV